MRKEIGALSCSLSQIFGISGISVYSSEGERNRVNKFLSRPAKVVFGPIGTGNFLDSMAKARKNVLSDRYFSEEEASRRLQDITSATKSYNRRRG